MPNPQPSTVNPTINPKSLNLDYLYVVISFEPTEN
jgi:hypothetical protein